ncbi:MAG: exosortase B [Acidobacteriota bacterium]
MTSGTLTASNTPLPATGGAPSHAELIAIGLGLVAMYAGTYATLNATLWKIVGQGHGPVMLALTLWLIWQRLPRFQALDAAPAYFSGCVSLVLGLGMYVIGRSQDVLFMDVASQMLVISGIVLLYKGWTGWRLMWFPIFFILFIIPIPGSVVDQVTAPLKAAVSYTSEAVLFKLGYPIGRSGVTLTIGPYQLLVADACAGLNSIFALEAIGVFYMSVAQHTNKWRNIILASVILPISFVSNVTRVCVLVLVTYYFGDEAGQGFVHGFAGILLFMLATILTISVDTFLGLFFKADTSSVSPSTHSST